MYDKSNKIEIPLNEPQTAPYIYVDENTGDLHLLVPFNSGRDISLDNTCKIMVELNKFFGHSELASHAIQSLRKYEEALNDDLLILPQNHPLRPQKEKRLQQVNEYIIAVNTMRDIYMAEFYSLIKIPSNLYFIQLRPWGVDAAFNVVNPVFHLDRGIDQSGTIRSAMFNAMRGVFETVNLGRKHPRQELEEETFKVLAENFSFNDVQVALENTCNILFKAKLSTESEESNVVNFHRNPKNELVTQEYIDATLGLDEDEKASAKQYISSLILVCAPDLWTSLSLSPFYSFDVNGHPDTKELVEHLSLTTQFFLGNMNVYCKVKGISQADFGSILDKHAVLSMSLAVTVKNALNKGRDVEQDIMDFIQKHHRVFEFAQDRKLETKHRNEIISQFNRNYATITGTPENRHWDDFMLVDLESNDKSAIFVSHQNRICLHIAEILRSAGIDNPIISGFYPGFSQAPRELPSYNNVPSVMVIDDKEEFVSTLNARGYDKLPISVQKSLSQPMLAQILQGQSLQKKLTKITPEEFNNYPKVIQQAFMEFDLKKLLDEITIEQYLALPALIKDACLKKEGFSKAIGEKITTQSSPEKLLASLGYDKFMQLQQPIREYCYGWASFQVAVLEAFIKEYDNEHSLEYAYSLDEKEFDTLPQSIKQYLFDYDFQVGRLDTSDYTRLVSPLKKAWKEVYLVSYSKVNIVGSFRETNYELSDADQKELSSFNVEKFIALLPLSRLVLHLVRPEIYQVCTQDPRFESMVLNKYLNGKTKEQWLAEATVNDFASIPQCIKGQLVKLYLPKFLNGESLEQKLSTITKTEFDEYPWTIQEAMLEFDLKSLFSMINYSQYKSLPFNIFIACAQKPGFPELVLELFKKYYTPDTLLQEHNLEMFLDLPDSIQDFCDESSVFQNKILDLFKLKYNTNKSIIDLLTDMKDSGFYKFPSAIKQYLLWYPLHTKEFIPDFLTFHRFLAEIQVVWCNDNEIQQKWIQQEIGNKDVAVFWAEYDESTCFTDFSHAPEFITQHLLNFDVATLVRLCGLKQFEKLPGFVIEKCKQDPQLSCYLLFAAFAQRTKEPTTLGLFRGTVWRNQRLVSYASANFDVEYFLNNLPYEDFSEINPEVNEKCKRHPNYHKILLNRYLNGKDLEERLANTSELEYEKLPEDIKKQCKKYDLNKLVRILDGRRTGIPDHILQVIDSFESNNKKAL